MTPRTRMIRNNVCMVGSLIIGILGFLWPGGVNIFMVFGAFLLFATSILDISEGEKENGKRSEEQNN